MQLRAPVQVGDTRRDFEASRLAGVLFIYAGYGFGQLPANEAPQRIRELADLPQLLQTFFALRSRNETSRLPGKPARLFSRRPAG